MTLAGITRLDFLRITAIMAGIPGWPKIVPNSASASHVAGDGSAPAPAPSSPSRGAAAFICADGHAADFGAGEV